jgi:hypothetical protein
MTDLLLAALDPATPLALDRTAAVEFNQRVKN